MNHYFIGKLLNPDDAKKLYGKQSFLSRNIPTTGKIFNFNTKFGYLGYMDEGTMLSLQDKLNNIFEALSNEFGPQKCKYIEYGITGLKTTKKSVSILYENDNIENIIVPYIRSYIDKITGETSYFYPHVALVRFDVRDQSEILKEDEKGKNILGRTFLPDPPEFLIDSVDILMGQTKIKRTGAPSKYDDMEMKVIHKYNLTGTK